MCSTLKKSDRLGYPLLSSTIHVFALCLKSCMITRFAQGSLLKLVVRADFSYNTGNISNMQAEMAAMKYGFSKAWDKKAQRFDLGI